MKRFLLALVFILVLLLITNKKDTSDMPNLLWVYETRGEIEGSVAFAQDKIYVPSEDGFLYALNTRGELLWLFDTKSPIIRSSPVVGKSSLYVGSDNHALTALNINGDVEWSFTTGSWVRSTPSIDEAGNIYVASYDNKLYSLSGDGVENWSFRASGGILSSPALDAEKGAIYFGSDDGNIYALEYETGDPLWFVDTGAKVFSSPAIDSDNSLYIGNEAGVLYALSDGGDILWTFDALGSSKAVGKGFESSPAIGPGVIYIGSKDHHVYAINKEDGSLMWKYKTGWEVESSPTIGQDGTIYIGSEDKKMYAISPSGERLWAFETGGQIDSPPLLIDEMLVFGSQDGLVYALDVGDATNEEYPWPRFKRNNTNSGL